MVPSRTRQRRWNGQRFEQINKAVNPNFEAMARAAGDSVQPRAFPLLDAINAATGEIVANGGVYGQFQAMPRDPRDDNAFGPMDPLRPEAIDLLDSDGRTEPRAMVYPVGWNLPGNGSRETPWAVLRAASMGVGIIRRCIEARKKDICDLELRFGPSEDAINDAYQANPSAGRLNAEQKLREELLPDINRLREFWLRPWRSKSWGFKQWARAALEDILTIDALPIYPRRTYGGEVYDLELIDGTTIKPLLDVRGNPPLPPFPALQQILYGFPRGEWAATVEYDDEGNAVLANGFQSSEMMYYVANPRTYSPFGFSPVEQALFDSRLYLQRQKWMLAEYEDGSTPLTWVETAAPSDGQQMTLTQQRLWEKAFNSRLSGNTRERVRARVLPNGWKAMMMATTDERYKPEYDLYLIKLLCGHFGLTATRLGFGESNGLGGSGFSEGQMAVTGELGLKPDTEVLTEIINQASCHFLGMDKRIKAIFVDPAESNTAEQATITDGQVKGAQISVNEARQKTGQSLLPFEEATMPFILGGPNGIIFLEGAKASIEAAQKAQQMQAETAALGTAGKLSIEEEKLKDGKEARHEEQELARETRDVTLEAQREQNEIKKSAEIRAFRTWRAKPANAGDQPRRPFVFKSVEPDDGWPELDGLGPFVVEFDGWEWMSDEADIIKGAKGAVSKLTYLEWNILHPERPKGPNGRWVKSGSTLADALREEAKRHAEATGVPSGASTSVKPMSSVPQDVDEFRELGEKYQAKVFNVTHDGKGGWSAAIGDEGHADGKNRWATRDHSGQWTDHRNVRIAEDDVPAHLDQMAKERADLRQKRADYQRKHRPKPKVEPLSDARKADLRDQRAEDLARARQARIDAVKPRAEFLADVEEGINTGADSATLRRMVEQSVRRNNLADDPVAGHVQLNMDRGALNTAAAAWGLRRIGDEGSFDPAMHKPVGDRPSVGGDIELVKPGYVFRDGGEDIQLMHAVVDGRIDATAAVDRPSTKPQSRLDELGNVHLDALEAMRSRDERRAYLAGLHSGQIQALQVDLGIKRRGRTKLDKQNAILDAVHERASEGSNSERSEMNIFTGEGVAEWKADAEAFIAAHTPEPIIDVRGREWVHMGHGSFRRADGSGQAGYTPEMIAGIKPLDVEAARKEIAELKAFKASLPPYVRPPMGEKIKPPTAEEAARIKRAQFANARIPSLEREIAEHEASQAPALDKPGIDSAGFVTSPMNAHSLGLGDQVVVHGIPAWVTGTRRDGSTVTLTLDDGRVLTLGLNEPVRRVHGGNLRKAADVGEGGADPKAPGSEGEPTPTTPPPPVAPDTRWPGWLMDMAIASVVASAILEAMPGLPIGDLISLFRRLQRNWPRDLPTWREMEPQARRGTVERVLWEMRQDGWPVRIADVLRDPVLSAHLEGHYVGQQVGQAVADATLDGRDITDPGAALRLSINWGDWTPGHPEAARLLIEPGGLERLLRESGIVSERLGDGRMDQVGRIIGEGLADGLSPREIARRLTELFGDPDWAMMTAVTETNRAMSAASVMQYREAGLLFKGWMTAFDQRVCKICDLNAHHPDGRPRIVPIDERFPSGDPWPPGHPRCRCAPIPVLSMDVNKALNVAQWNAQNPRKLKDAQGRWSDTPDLPDMPIRPALAGEEKISGLRAAFEREAKRITGNRIYNGLQGNVDTAREHMEGILRCLERFPNVRLHGVSMGTHEPGTYAFAGGRWIRFTSEWTASKKAREKYLASLANGARGWDEPKRMYSEWVPTSFHVRNSYSPMSVAIHEFGHILDIDTLSERIQEDMDALIERRRAELSREVMARRAAEGLETWEFTASEVIEREVSSYALKNRRELAAEAFTDVMLNGDKASVLSRGIFDLLAAAYKRWDS